MSESIDFVWRTLDAKKIIEYESQDTDESSQSKKKKKEAKEKKTEAKQSEKKPVVAKKYESNEANSISKSFYTNVADDLFGSNEAKEQGPSKLSTSED